MNLKNLTMFNIHIIRVGIKNPGRLPIHSPFGSLKKQSVLTFKIGLACGVGNVLKTVIMIRD
jgi:hypothetical protein